MIFTWNRFYTSLFVLVSLTVVSLTYGDFKKFNRVGYKKYIGVSNICQTKDSFYFDSDIKGVRTIRLIGTNLHSFTVEEEIDTVVGTPCIEIWYDSERRQRLNVLIYKNVSYAENL